MGLNLKLMQQEEELDFMPIIPLNEGDDENIDKIDIPAELPLLPLRNTVLFPGVVIPITVGRDKSIKAIEESYKTDKLVGVLSQKDSNVEDPGTADLMGVGTVAKIVKLIKMPDGGTTAILQGKKRFKLLRISSEDPYFKGIVEALDEQVVKDDQSFNASVASIKDLAAQIIQLSPNIPTEASIILRNIENPSFLIHFVGSNLNCELSEKQALLEMNDMRQRAELLLKLLQNELQFVELKNKVTTKTKTELDKQQREYFLQQQLKSIKEELGGDSNDREIQEMKKKAEDKKWSAAAKELFQKEIEKLERMHPSTPDYSTVYNHVDLMLDLPWDECTTDSYDLKKAKKVLDKDHYGMEKIKERILEYLAVLKLKGDMKSPILCFVGPPGIGKTSLGKKYCQCNWQKICSFQFGWPARRK